MHGSVLIADDEQTWCESTSRLLQREGYDCQSVNDGEQAVETLRQRRFDVLVSDIRMPNNSDMQVVAAARELDNDLAIILVTGYPSADTAIRAIELPVAAYLTKPVEFQSLLWHVHKGVERSSRRRTLRSISDRLESCASQLYSTTSGSLARHAEACEVDRSLLRTVALCLSELLELSDSSQTASGEHTILCDLLDCPQKPAARELIVDAIETLKDTKDKFKCRALADLRTRLEAFLGG